MNSDASVYYFILESFTFRLPMSFRNKTYDLLWIHKQHTDRSQSVGPVSSNVESSPKRQVRSGSAAPAASTTAAKTATKKTPANTPTIVERRPRPSKCFFRFNLYVSIEMNWFVSLADYMNTTFCSTYHENQNKINSFYLFRSIFHLDCSRFDFHILPQTVHVRFVFLCFSLEFFFGLESVIYLSFSLFLCL